MRRAAVWGDPIAHSLSPVLHRAAYRALDLTDWQYTRALVDEAHFGEALASLDESWRGLSLTMPLKDIALQSAQQVSSTARLAGAANTYVRRDGQWRADNTDVSGLVAALREGSAQDGVACAPHHVDRRPLELSAPVILGAGATARSALVALAELGAIQVHVLARRMPDQTMQVAQRCGLRLVPASLSTWPVAPSVVISTIPPQAAGDLAAGIPPAHGGARLMDVVYGLGQTPLMTQARRRGYVVISGTEMLLHQAVAQVELMTGHPGPLAAMRAALVDALS